MVLNVLYSCNDEYAMQASVSILSLCANNKEFEMINIYFVEDNLSELSKERLYELVKTYSVALYFCEFDEFCKELTVKQGGRHPNTIFTKLFATQLENVDKIIYIDCDTVIKGSFLELWNMDMGENLIAGVAMPYAVEIKKNVGMKECDRYICDGFVVMNLNKWREEDVTGKGIRYIEKWNGIPPMLSEGTINHVCRGRIITLEPKYNLMSIMLLLNSKGIKKLFGINEYYTQTEIDEAREKPVLIHYLNELYNRPWNKKCDHPLKNEFLDYLRRTPWRNYKLENKDISFKTKLVRWSIQYFSISIVFGGRNLYKKIKGKR